MLYVQIYLQIDYVLNFVHLYINIWKIAHIQIKKIGSLKKFGLVPLTLGKNNK